MYRSVDKYIFIIVSAAQERVLPKGQSLLAVGKTLDADPEVSDENDRR